MMAFFQPKPDTSTEPTGAALPSDSVPAPLTPITEATFEVQGIRANSTKVQKLLSNLNNQQLHHHKEQRRIGQLLIERGFIAQEQLKNALTESRASGVPVGQIMVSQGMINEHQLGMCLAEMHNLPYINTHAITLQIDCVKLLNEEFIRKNQVIPYRLHEESQLLEVIMVHPDYVKVIDEISLITQYRVQPLLTTSMEMKELLDGFFAKEHSTQEALELLEKDALSNRAFESTLDVNSELENEFSASSTPIVKFVNALLINAIERGASDIHLESQPQRLLVRMRMDGILEEIQSVPLKMAPAIISRIKVVSGMDIAEKRKPQDGRMRHQYGSQAIDMRVSTIPLPAGEKVVIRSLKINTTTNTLDRLGIEPKVLDQINRMIRAPHGMILITGPTGSGKSTTLYAALRALNSASVNISTIEDPIEYTLPGVNQMQVNTKAGVTFASALRALLRQDPDVVMVGEIRDHETLEAALEASLTGHLVFSTLHTNSCSKTIARLIEMGAPAYLVSTSLVGVMAQRLARRLCSHCKEPVTTTPEMMKTLGIQQPTVIHRAVGCAKCNHKGYKGRLMFLEVMPITRHLAALIDERASTVEIEDAAIQSGMLLLKNDATRKVLMGDTSIDEMLRVLGFDMWSESGG